MKGELRFYKSKNFDSAFQIRQVKEDIKEKEVNGGLW